jgi:hypothetical protein
MQQMKWVCLGAALLLVASVAWAQVAPDPADGDRMAKIIRAQGWTCGLVVYMEEIKQTSDGSKFVKLTCDGAGPFYEVHVWPDGHQTMRPLE